MNRPNRPEQPSLVTTAYLDDKLRDLETKLLTTFARELDARFEQFTQNIELRLTRFEKRLAWQIVGTLAGTIVAMTAIFSAVVLIISVD